MCYYGHVQNTSNLGQGMVKLIKDIKAEVGTSIFSSPLNVIPLGF